MLAPELKLLVAAILLGMVHLGWAAFAARGAQKDIAWAAGPRDTPMPLDGVAGRLDRAFRNFMETFPFYAAAVLVAALAAKFSPLTLWGSVLYVAGRALYVPIYAAGTPWLRTVVWFVSVVGIAMILSALFR